MLLIYNVTYEHLHRATRKIQARAKFKRGTASTNADDGKRRHPMMRQQRRYSCMNGKTVALTRSWKWARDSAVPDDDAVFETASQTIDLFVPLVLNYDVQTYE